MRWSNQVIIGMLFCGIALTGQIIAKTEASAPTFAQIILPFPGERPFTYEWKKDENTLFLRFPKSSPEELDAINHYDERLIRRVLLKDLGPEGTEVRLVLKDRNVRAMVSTFKDPFRIAIDLFDKNYVETKDPESGLPLTTASSGSAEAAIPKELMQPTQSDAQSQKQAAEHKESPSSKRRLLQATPDEINSPNELRVMIAKIDPGVGKAWSSYPPYIYRLQLAPYEGREAPTGETTPLQTKALHTSSAMADYAGKLFDFGHEGRALVAYQQVLRKEPGVFEKDPVHLWKFAETHLGQGNLTLADGYYQTLIEKHPDHMMARFAKLRKIDTKAIKAISDEETNKLPKLAEQLASLPTRDNAELGAMIAIRNAWWNDKTLDQKSRKALPICPEDISLTLKRLAPRIESPKTAYLASALVASRLTNPETPWQNDYAPWLTTFFNRYRGAQDSGERSALSEAAKKRLTKQFHDLFTGNQYEEVVNLYNQLPQEMKSISKDTNVSWQVAESFRLIGQQDRAIPFYKTASTTDATVDKFKSSFWVASLASRRSAELRASRGNQATIDALDRDASSSDKRMSDLWSKLKGDEKSTIMTALSKPIQDIVSSEAKLRTPAIIILEQHKTALTSNPPKMNATSGTSSSDWIGSFSPSGATVKLLDDLGRKFAELGMTKERRQAIELMRFLKPSQFEQDKEAAKLWDSELLKLAEEHRKADEFLQAGELYTLVGDSTLQSEKRAESLYKGGLLLFRAGKKQDAVSALEKAKSDTSNLFYSKLATERLNQIDTK